MFKRIKYVSRFAPSLATEAVQDIVESSLENNPNRGITGLLVMSGGVFFQVLEGPAAEVDALWAVIRQDPRHDDVLLLDSLEDCPERLFPDWSLEKVDLDASADERLAPTRALLSAVLAQRALLEQMIGTLERVVWAETVTPSPA